MYAMTGRLTAQLGQRGELVHILEHAADLVGELPACRLYLVCEDLSNDTDVWVFEAWDDKPAHDASLTDVRVRALIAEARPLLAAAPDGAELEIVGGYGI